MSRSEHTTDEPSSYTDSPTEAFGAGTDSLSVKPPRRSFGEKVMEMARNSFPHQQNDSDRDSEKDEYEEWIGMC